MNFFEVDPPANIDKVGRKLIENAKRAILETDKTNPDRDKIIEEAMNQMYNYLSSYFEGDLRNFNFQIELFGVEKLLEKEFLPLQSEPIYEKGKFFVLPDSINDSKDAEAYMDYIVHQTRKYLSKYYDIKNDSLEKKCIDTSFELEEFCSYMHINTIHLGVDQDIKPGFFHHFSIVQIPLSNGTAKYYLADCTYRQFFTKEKANRRRIAVMRGPAAGCSIGSYMMLNEKRKKIAETILTKGYIELTLDVIKEYFDAIVFSGRDKEFYEQHRLRYLDDNDIVPKFSAVDYLQMLIENRVCYKKTIKDIATEILGSSELCPSQTDFYQTSIPSIANTNEKGDKRHE